MRINIFKEGGKGDEKRVKEGEREKAVGFGDLPVRSRFS